MKERQGNLQRSSPRPHLAKKKTRDFQQDAPRTRSKKIFSRRRKKARGLLRGRNVRTKSSYGDHKSCTSGSAPSSYEAWTGDDPGKGRKGEGPRWDTKREKRLGGGRKPPEAGAVPPKESFRSQSSVKKWVGFRKNSGRPERGSTAETNLEKIIPVRGGQGGEYDRPSSEPTSKCDPRSRDEKWRST